MKRNKQLRLVRSQLGSEVRTSRAIPSEQQQNSEANLIEIVPEQETFSMLADDQLN